MRRLVWIGVGAATAVAVAHKLGLIAFPGSRVEDRSETPLVLVARGIFVAGRTAGGMREALRQASRDLVAGMSEREAELRDGLIGDVNVDELRAERAAARAPRSRWADTPTDDSPDDGGLPYSFF